MVMPIFLHGNFAHLLYNTAFQVIFGIQFEFAFGAVKIGLIYIISGIGGNLFSSLLSDECSVGTSTCIFGLFGSILGYLLLNWKALSYKNSRRNEMIIFILLIIILNTLSGINQPRIDNWGHFGGLLVGLFMGFILLDPVVTDSMLVNGRDGYFRSTKMRVISLIFLAVYFFGGFWLFYSFRNPQ